MENLSVESDVNSFFGLLGWSGEGWGKSLANGSIVTLEISVGAFTTGILIGGLVAWTKLSGPRWARIFANAYSSVCRSVPDLLLILLLFYAGQSALNAFLAILGIKDMDVSGFGAAIVVLGLVQGAYASEILRGAILAIPKGQVEAARAFGLEGFTLARRVLIPAILPLALAGLSNLWMSILKDSVLVSVVGTSELLFTAKQAGGATKAYFTFYLSAGAIFYAMTLASNLGLQLIETRVRRWMPRAS